MQIIVDAGKWQAGYDMDTGRIGSQIAFMKGWPVEDIVAYCTKHQWKVQIIGEEMIPVHDYGCDG